MEPPPLPAPAHTPTAPERRMEYLDALRGIALLGILLVNMHGFKSSLISWNPSETYLPGALNTVTVCVLEVFASRKFVSIFSFLFGLGLALQGKCWRTEGSARLPFAGFVSRRMAVLLVLGVLHGIFLWAGDILTMYAVMGLSSIVLVRRRIRTLLILAGCVLVLYSAYMALLGLVMEGIPAASPDWRETADAWVECYQTGNVSWIISSRFTEWKYVLAVVVFYQFPHSFILFLLGMCAGKIGPGPFLEFLRRRARPWLAPALAIALPLCWLGLVHGLGEFRSVPGSWLVLALDQAIGTTLLALCYITGGALFFSSGRWPCLTALLAGAGRLSLTNYLLQSVIANVAFMSWGLALYGRTTSQAGVLLAVPIFTAQLFLSRILLRHFRTGPMEWLWRQVSYLGVKTPAVTPPPSLPPRPEA